MGLSRLVDNVDNRKDKLCYILLLLVSILFLLVHSSNTSPFYIGYGGDSAIFLVMGKMLLAGKIPYLDFFDHKGPMIILIEAFGQSVIPDRSGVFILQIFNLFLSLLLIYKTARLFLEEVNSFTVALISLWFFAFTMEGGNLTEEYSLPFLLFSLYIAVKVLQSSSKDIKQVHFLLLGISAASLLWIRLNNTSVALVTLVFIFVVFLKERNTKGVQNLIIYYLLGILLVSLPFIYYFYSKGAFREMLFAAFFYNFKYIGIDDSPSPFHSIVDAFFYLLKAWVPFVVLIIGTIMYYTRCNRNYKVILLSALLLIVGYASTHIGAAYYHYMTLNIPCLTLGCIYLAKTITLVSPKKKWGVLFFFSLCLVLFTVHRFKSKDALGEGDSLFITQSQDVISQIPLSERNSIYGYHTMARFHVSSQSFPCYKYFVMQEWQGKYNPDLLKDINHMLETNPPKWVVTQFRDQSTNKKFWEIVDSKYELYYTNNFFELFRLKQDFR